MGSERSRLVQRQCIFERLFDLCDVLRKPFLRPCISRDGRKNVDTYPAGTHGQPAGPEAMAFVYDNRHDRQSRGKREVSDSLLERL